MPIRTRNKSLLTIPDDVRRRAGLKRGQEVEFKVSDGVISVLPKVPPADNEYTPKQRRLIDERLAEARRGPYYGPFHSAEEMLESMKGRDPKAARNKRRA